LDLMRDLKTNRKTAIILITHDLGVVAEMADDVAVMYGGQVVESGTADMIFENPVHPYTHALMESIPTIHESRDRLATIPGTVPSAANFPPGCRFADRCSLAQSQCHEKMPELREVEPGHMIRCDVVAL